MSDKVRLESDKMSKEEMESRNGAVVTYPLDVPRRWEEYRALPEDIRREYLKHLKEKYQVTNNRIAEMLGTTGQTMNNELKYMGLTKYTPGKGHAMRMSQEQLDAWEEFRKKEGDNVKRELENQEEATPEEHDQPKFRVFEHVQKELEKEVEEETKQCIGTVTDTLRSIFGPRVKFVIEVTT